jgi:hypothetical protein
MHQNFDFENRRYACDIVKELTNLFMPSGWQDRADEVRKLVVLLDFCHEYTLSISRRLISADACASRL